MGRGALVHLLGVATVRQGTKQGEDKGRRVVGGKEGWKGEGKGERVTGAEEWGERIVAGREV